MKKPASLAKSGLSFVVRLAGIEPTTPWFVAKYSIQLSYSREALDSTQLWAVFRPGTNFSVDLIRFCMPA